MRYRVTETYTPDDVRLDRNREVAEFETVSREPEFILRLAAEQFGHGDLIDEQPEEIKPQLPKPREFEQFAAGYEVEAYSNDGVYTYTIESLGD